MLRLFLIQVRRNARDAVQTNTLSSDGSANTLIEIDGVGKTFTGQDGEQIVALEGTELEIRHVEFVSILGQSGCGKGQGQEQDGAKGRGKVSSGTSLRLSFAYRA